MVTVTHVNMIVSRGKQKGLESLSENREWRRRCDVERQVVQTVAPETGNARLPTVETNGQSFQTMRGRLLQPSSGCHVGNTGETRL